MSSNVDQLEGISTAAAVTDTVEQLQRNEAERRAEICCYELLNQRALLFLEECVYGIKDLIADHAGKVADLVSEFEFPPLRVTCLALCDKEQTAAKPLSGRAVIQAAQDTKAHVLCVTEVKVTTTGPVDQQIDNRAVIRQALRDFTLSLCVQSGPRRGEPMVFSDECMVFSHRPVSGHDSNAVMCLSELGPQRSGECTVTTQVPTSPTFHHIDRKEFCSPHLIIVTELGLRVFCGHVPGDDKLHRLQQLKNYITAYDNVSERAFVAALDGDVSQLSPEEMREMDGFVASRGLWCRYDQQFLFVGGSTRRGWSSFSCCSGNAINIEVLPVGNVRRAIPREIVSDHTETASIDVRIRLHRDDIKHAIVATTRRWTVI